MRTARRSSSAYDGLLSALKAMLARRAQELTGLFFVALAGAVAVALATWSVDDPSLNNATAPATAIRHRPVSSCARRARKALTALKRPS